MSKVMVILLFLVPQLLVSSCITRVSHYQVYYVLKPEFQLLEDRTGKKLSKADKNRVLNESILILKKRFEAIGAGTTKISIIDDSMVEITSVTLDESAYIKGNLLRWGVVEFTLISDEFTEKVTSCLKRNPIGDGDLSGEKGYNAIRKSIDKQCNIPKNLKTLFIFTMVSKTKKMIPQSPVVVYRTPSLDGRDIARAWISRGENGHPMLSFVTTKGGSKKLAEVTSKKNRGKRMAVVYNNRVRSAPTINDQIKDGEGQVIGNFTLDEVSELRSIFKSGFMPLTFTIVEEREDKISLPL